MLAEQTKRNVINFSRFVCIKNNLKSDAYKELQNNISTVEYIDSLLFRCFKYHDGEFFDLAFASHNYCQYYKTISVIFIDSQNRISYVYYNITCI